MPAIQSIRIIRRKLRAVNNIKKITRAMQMVSAAKLKKVQARLMQLRPYAGKIRELVEGLDIQLEAQGHPLFREPENVQTIGLVVMTADKGLCGSFNAGIINYAQNFINRHNGKVKIFAIGKKAENYFRRRNFEILEAYTHLPVELPFSKIQEMAQKLLRFFERGIVDTFYIIYTHYVNALTYRLTELKFLPIDAEEIAEKGKAISHEYIFEPKLEKILEKLIPRYIETTFHRLILESMSSEQAARMNAMRNATDNAEEFLDELTLNYNKARQSGITKELLDIVGGTEALK